MQFYGTPGTYQALSCGFLGSHYCLLITTNMVKVLLFSLLPQQTFRGGSMQSSLMLGSCHWSFSSKAHSFSKLH